MGAHVMEPGAVHPLSPTEPATSSARLLMVGFDGAPLRLMQWWIGQGWMPQLSRFFDESPPVEHSTPPVFGDDELWPSIALGVNPGRHGRYHYVTVDRRTGRRKRYDSSELTGRPFWQILSEAGCRVAVIDVPKVGLSPNLDGIQILDWRVHGRDDETRTTPGHLTEQLENRFGPDEADDLSNSRHLCAATNWDDVQLPELLASIEESLKAKSTVSEELLARGRWDLFLTVFSTTHCFAHAFWHLVDLDHPRHDPAQLRAFLPAIERIARGLDAAFGELWAHAGDDAAVIVFSTTGMAPTASGNHLLDRFLMRRSAMGRLWSASIEALTPHLGSRGNRQVARVETLLRSVRRTYALPHTDSGAIRIKRRSDLKQLREDLHALTRATDGSPIVASVIETSTLCHGEAMQRLPDVYVEWDSSGPIEHVTSPRTGHISVASREWRPGQHAPGGFLAIRAGRNQSMLHGDPPSLLDLAPTAVHVLGCSLPGAEGRSLVGFTDSQVL